MTESDDFKKNVKMAVKGDKDAFSRLYTLVYKEMYYKIAFPEEEIRIKGLGVD